MDVWAVGITLHFMLFHSLPFMEPNEWLQRLSVLGGINPFDLAIRTCDTSVLKLLQGALETDVQKRWGVNYMIEYIGEHPQN